MISVELAGRKIEVYRFREDPSRIFIDVMQKEGDCPKGYTAEQMKRCRGDCQNTFLTFVYSPLTGGVVEEGALLNNGRWHYVADALKKHGCDPRSMNIDAFIASIWNDVIHGKKDGTESLVYKGDEIAFRKECAFEVVERYETPDQTVRQYQELMRRFPRRVLENAGIGFHGPSGNIITLKPEHIRSIKSIIAH